MPTKLPRVTVVVQPDMLALIEEHRFDFRHKTQTDTVLDLIKRGLNDAARERGTPEPFPIPAPPK